MLERNVEHGTRTLLTDVSMNRRRRTLAERLLLRVPSLARVGFLFWSRLSPRSRLRRIVLVRAVSRLVSAANRRDFDVLLIGVHPEVDYRGVPGEVGIVPPDLAGHHYGHEGYREVWQAMIEAFDDLALLPQELIDLGDRLLVLARITGHGSLAGTPFDQDMAQVMTLRDGLIVKQEDFGDIEEGLRAAGLADSVGI